MVQHKLSIVREGVMTALIAFSIIVLGVNAHYIFITMKDVLFIDEFPIWPVESPDPFSVLNLAVAVLTILTVSAMLLIDRFRSGAFTSMIFFEMTWLGVLCVLWLAAASFTVNSVKLLLPLCSAEFNKDVAVLQAGCKDVKTAEAFGHLAWVTLLGYIAALFFLSYKSSQKGKPVWRMAVSQTNFVTNMQILGVGHHNENAGRHDSPAKDEDPAAGQQNLGYAYPPSAQPMMQQYNMSQQQSQMPAQQGNGQGQGQYGQTGQPMPPYGVAQV